MRIFMVCPAPRGSRKGNRVTAERWAAILRHLGHRVTIHASYRGARCDVLVALHARKSWESVRDYRKTCPQGRVIVALTGTDLYRDIQTSRRARQSLEWADRLVVLQRMGSEELPRRFRSKVRVIYQSAQPTPNPPSPKAETFDVCVLGHLRYEKDPFRAALAARLLPARSRVRIMHLGQALSDDAAKRARVLAAKLPRYRWLGEVSRARARRILAGSRLLVLTSRMEGGANVISEAIADDVPVLSSRIAGSEGILGRRYPGFFPVGDTLALACLLHRAESDDRYYNRLRQWCHKLKPLVDPARERRAWADLLEEMRPTSED